MKHEYEVRITYTEYYSVYVEAENDEQARELALAKYHNGEAEVHHERTDVDVEWSDEEN